MGRRRSPADALGTALADRRVSVVCGSGGAGKTTPAPAPPRPRLPRSPGPPGEVPGHADPALLPEALLRGRPPDPQDRHADGGHGAPADRPVPGPAVPSGPFRVLPGLRGDVRWIQGASRARARPPARPLFGLRAGGGAFRAGARRSSVLPPKARREENALCCPDREPRPPPPRPGRRSK